MGCSESKEERSSEMSKLAVFGGTPLNGKIKISGAKNAVLPIMAASILTDETVTLTNVPRLGDVHAMISLLQEHGVTVDDSDLQQNTLKLRARTIATTESPPEISKQMRASILVLGPLLARCGSVTTLQPGGCKIGKRPIDIHLDSLRKLGATIREREDGKISGEVRGTGKKLHGCDIKLKCPSVGATENILMAACLAEGTTTIRNAAKEPEVHDLAACLQRMGAKISFSEDGGSTITIHGVRKLSGATHDVLPDRIEAGTYAIAACATKGCLELEGISPDTMEPTLGYLEQAGAQVQRKPNGVVVSMTRAIRAVPVVETKPHPGFPTDMQSPWVSLMCLAQGKSEIKETLFENRFQQVGDLRRMGASITCAANGRSVTVTGVRRLKGKEVWATDLRASASLLIAALSAQGWSTINDIYHLERGYESVVEKLRNCGANIQKTY